MKLLAYHPNPGSTSDAVLLIRLIMKIVSPTVSVYCVGLLVGSLAAEDDSQAATCSQRVVSNCGKYDRRLTHFRRTFQGRRSLWDRGDTSPNIWTGGHYHECPPNISKVISYFLSTQYFIAKLKEFLVFLVFSRLVQGVVGTL